MLATQNTLFDEFNSLKEERRTRPPTPMGNAMPNEVPEELVEEEVYEGWQGGNVRNRVNNLEIGRFGRGNGAQGRIGGGNGMNGRLGMGNQHGRIDPYGDRFRGERYHEEEPRVRFEGPSKTLKHSLPEFHGKFDPEAYLEWESQVDKIFALHNYSEVDKVKVALAEFRGHADTWWNDLMRRRRLARLGDMQTWEEMRRIMKETFVPRSYYLKLRGELQDLRQGTKSVMDYYYELLSLMSKIGMSEPEETTQDRFIHGLNIPLKHKVQIEAYRGITLGEVIGFAEAFERQSKEMALNKTKMTSNQSGM